LQSHDDVRESKIRPVNNGERPRAGMKITFLKHQALCQPTVSLGFSLTQLIIGNSICSDITFGQTFGGFGRQNVRWQTAIFIPAAPPSPPPPTYECPPTLGQPPPHFV
jgi:hypothetical protein